MEEIPPHPEDEAQALPAHTRRSFFGKATAAIIAFHNRRLIGQTAEDSVPTNSPHKTQSAPSANPAAAMPDRLERAFLIRKQAAETSRRLPVRKPPVLENDEERRYPNRIASFSKGLPHNDLGEVHLPAYLALSKAISSGKSEDFESVPLGGELMLVNPLAAHAFTLEGCDACQIEIAEPPPFASAEMAAEAVELYWQALARDEAFADYSKSEIIAQAAEDIGSRYRDSYHGPNDAAGTITPAQIFRDTSVGSLAGPYLSQFLWMDVPYGATTITQRYKVAVAGEDFLIDRESLLRNQRGRLPIDAIHFDPEPRYLRTGRDLAEYVHRCFLYQEFLNAALILAGANYARYELRAPLSPFNPYADSLTQKGFITFGTAHVLELIARATALATRIGWYQKWLLFRKLRPEAFGLRVHNQMTALAKYPIHDSLFSSPVLLQTHQKYGTWLLPQAYPEGCPAHPAYPAGHAVGPGAAATILKAFFDETAELPKPVQPSSDGRKLNPYTGGERLTVGGEVNKLATNIAFGRGFAGIHWRSDSTEGLRSGERAAIAVLRDWKAACVENPKFRFTSFDGQKIVI